MWFRRSGLLISGILVGCGSTELERTVVSGAVNYRSKPVLVGLIRFVAVNGTKGACILENL